jgi:hypothetical protein
LNTSRGKWSGGSVPKRWMSPANLPKAQRSVSAPRLKLGAISPVRSNACARTRNGSGRKRPGVRVCGARHLQRLPAHVAICRVCPAPPVSAPPVSAPQALTSALAAPRGRDNSSRLQSLRAGCRQSQALIAPRTRHIRYKTARAATQRRYRGRLGSFLMQTAGTPLFNGNARWCVTCFTCIDDRAVTA